MMGRYRSIEKQAWEWFIPTILPNLSLIISSLYLDKTKSSNFKIDKFFYVISRALSYFYLLMLLVLIFSYSSEKGNIIEYYKSYNIPITTIQTFVTVSLASFLQIKDNVINFVSFPTSWKK
jgi:hypothetical protein